MGYFGPAVLQTLDIKKRLEEIGRENIAVIVIGAGDYALLLDEGEVDPSGLGESIRKLLAANPALIVWIRATEEARYGDFVTVLEAVKKAGAMRILINEDGLPPRDAVE